MPSVQNTVDLYLHLWQSLSCNYAKLELWNIVQDTETIDWSKTESDTAKIVVGGVQKYC